MQFSAANYSAGNLFIYSVACVLSNSQDKNTEARVRGIDGSISLPFISRSDIQEMQNIISGPKITGAIERVSSVALFF